MAVYFKFHSLDDIRAEVDRLGLSLRFDPDLSPLLRPVRVGPLTAGNALCIQPMEGCDCTPDGHPDELTFRRYRRFGAGGAKLIWGEAAAVAEEARANPRQLLINDATIGGIARMFTECRQAHVEAFGSDDGLVVGLQLTHSGRYSHRRPLTAVPCPLLDPRTRDQRLLTDEELDRLPDLYVKAARLARDVGFHFVDVKQCHRYLLNELLGARGRPGPYGGDFENRTRLARTIFERLRAEVPGVVVTTRMNVFDGVPFGGDRGGGEAVWGADCWDAGVPDLTEPIRWVGEMRDLGVAMVNVSLGNPYASPHLIRPFEYPPPDGYETPEHPLIGVDRHVRLTEAIQRAHPDLPVVGSGYSYLQEFFPQAGAANLADGRVTFVGVGRASLSMPDFGRLLAETGKLDRKRVCRTFSYCTALMRSKHNELGQFATGCPPFDKEAYGPLWELARRKDEG
ncbi:MAG: NADH:flavin oxidoreductase [Gemmataceae bacterium]